MKVYRDEPEAWEKFCAVTAHRTEMRWRKRKDLSSSITSCCGKEFLVTSGVGALASTSTTVMLPADNRDAASVCTLVPELGSQVPGRTM